MSSATTARDENNNGATPATSPSKSAFQPARGLPPRIGRDVAFFGAGVVVGCLVATAVWWPRPNPDTSTGAGARPDPTAATDTAAPDGTSPYRAYGMAANSFLYQNIQDAPLHPESAAIVADLADQVSSRYNGVAAVNAYEYGVSFFEATPDTPRVDVEFWDCQNKGYFPEDLAPALVNVPIPPKAVPAAGTDNSLAVYDPTSDTLWEFWNAERTDTGWRACWGGRIDDASASPGYFDGNTGATATGIAQSAGMVTAAEAAVGDIDHAMCLIVAEAQHHSVYSWPAQRSDGNTSKATTVAQGARIRLAADVPVDDLDLTPFARAVAHAAQRHGFVVCDKGGAVAVQAESGDQALARTGVNPWDELFGDTPPYEQMRGFPWDRMEVIEPNWGAPADAETVTPSLATELSQGTD